jgi:release factor glutamine methyltransferase
MLTIINAVELSAEYLGKKSVASARINAELLLAHILNCKRMDLYLKFDQPLTNEETLIYREYIKRRGQREPLQYIIGSVEFYGLEFIVNKSVLIPRQETEILVEEIIKRSDKSRECRILDIGSGSGNIAIALSKNLPNSIVHSIDISEQAITLSKKNAEFHNLNGQLSFENIDVNNFVLENKSKYDIIVSNPPYISLNEYGSLEKELLEHEPKVALTDSKDGYSFYDFISSRSMEFLKPNGKLFFEVGLGQFNKVSSLVKDSGFNKVEIIKDYLDIERVVIGEL